MGSYIHMKDEDMETLKLTEAESHAVYDRGIKRTEMFNESPEEMALEKRISKSYIYILMKNSYIMTISTRKSQRDHVY